MRTVILWGSEGDLDRGYTFQVMRLEGNCLLYCLEVGLGIQENTSSLSLAVPPVTPLLTFYCYSRHFRSDCSTTIKFIDKIFFLDSFPDDKDFFPWPNSTQALLNFFSTRPEFWTSVTLSASSKFRENLDKSVLLELLIFHIWSPSISNRLSHLSSSPQVMSDHPGLPLARILLGQFSQNPILLPLTSNVSS